MLVKRIFQSSFVCCLLFIGLLLFFNFKTNQFLIKGKSNAVTQLKDGDIVFQINQSGQGKAIQIATHSKFTHCGVIFKENNVLMVYEAVQPVKKTRLTEWVKFGENNSYEVKRLKNATGMTDADLDKMKTKFNEYEGKNYDLYFGWSDEKIYCSELVWKLYSDALDIELGALQKLKDFDLRHPAVKEKLKERYGDKIPFEELVISPAAIYESNLLESVIIK